MKFIPLGVLVTVLFGTLGITAPTGQEPATAGRVLEENCMRQVFELTSNSDVNGGSFSSRVPKGLLSGHYTGTPMRLRPHIELKRCHFRTDSVSKMPPCLPIW